MKLARYMYKDEESYGILKEQTIISLPKVGAILHATLPITIEEFIALGQIAQVTVEGLMAIADEDMVEEASFQLSQVQLLAPIKSPPKILCLGWNYVDHAAETKITLPEEPVVFMKPHTAIVGPDEKILKRPFVKELDYEGEILNDVSARDFQFKDKQWTRGKGFDTFAPTGPCITMRDQLPDPSNLQIRTWVNGELRQNGTTHDMVFNVAQIIYHLSRVMTLEPCDIIATGTPSGVGMAMKPQTWLRDGDVVQIEIESIGKLDNIVQEL